MSDTKRVTESALQAGFKAGWAAACLAVADEIRKAGAPGAAQRVAGWAGHPPEVELADLSTPEGQKMYRESEVVYEETTRAAPVDAATKEGGAK